MRLRTGRGGAIAPASTITSWKGRRAALLLSAALLVGSPIANAADEATWTRYLDAGTSAYNRRDPDEATRQFELALKEAEGFGESDARLATTLAWLAELYRVQRRFDESERLIRRTISIDEKFRGPDHPDLGMSLESLALLYHTQNRQREMEPVLIRAITIYEKALGPQHQRVASSLNNLAALYRSIGRLNEAEPLVSRSLAIREKVLGMDHPDTVQSRNYLALLHRDMARARPTARQPVRQPEIVQQPAPPVAEVAPAPAPVQTPVPAPTVAPAPAAAPAPIAQSRPVEQPAPPVQAALPTPAPAPVAPPAKPAPPPVVAIAPAPVIQLSPPAPKPAPAPPSAPAIQPNSPPAQISAVTPAPQPSKPEPAREAAAVVPPALPVVVAPAPVPPAVPASPKSAPPAPQAALDPRPAPPPIQPAPVASRLYRSSLAMQMSLLGASGTQTSSAAVARAFEVMQLARNRHETGAVSRMAARFGRTDDGLARVASVREDLLDRWHGLDKTLMDVSGGAGVQRASGEETRLREELAGIDRQIAQQDVLIEQRVPGFRNYLNPETLPLAAAQTMLASDEALLSYMVDDNASYLVVVRSDRIALHTLDIGRNELGSIIKRLREQLDYPTGDDVARTVFRAYPVAQANQLYRRILGAAEPALQGASHLMIVADDSLNGLPFAALVTDAYAATLRDAEEHAKVAWLGRRYALTMLPSEGVLRSLRRAAAKPQATKPFAGFGDPLLGGEGRGVRSGTATRVYSRDALANVNQIWNFAPLPETRYALHAMADLLKAEPGDVHLQAEASESGVKRFDLSDYRVIAFATHGFMADDFKGLAESALVFTPPQRGTEVDDGLLTASEIAQLKLNAELVILTATSTASADGTPDAEGVSGLARAFFHAGDRAVLATHWAVPSDATLKLVTRTLRERARGVGNAEALRRAMLPLMNGEDRLSFAHPSYWAPFMVIGEGRPASGQASAAVAPVNRDPSTVETTGGQASESSGPGFGRFFQGIFGGEPAKR